MVRQLHTAAAKDPLKAENKKRLNTEFEEVAKQLSNLFQSAVQFKINEKGRGKIVIPFDGSEEMERIIALLDKLNR